ncbi:MAG: TatD family hydrolase [Thermoleophilia bacterium]
MPPLVDSHAHLDLLEDSENALIAAREAGVDRIVAVGIDLASSRRAVDFSATNDFVYAAVGIRPHDAGSVDDWAISELQKLAGSGKVVAIGETGLDYYRDRAPRESQKAAFIRHMELARETGLPLIVHSREANEDVLQMLELHATGLTVILHCFSLHGRVEECAGRGYFMSVAGNVTFNNATALREAVKKIPADLLLTETDSPYLSPVPHRGKKNQPAWVASVLEELARLRAIEPSLLAGAVHKNFLAAFGGPVR